MAAIPVGPIYCGGSSSSRDTPVRQHLVDDACVVDDTLHWLGLLMSSSHHESTNSFECRTVQSTCSVGTTFVPYAFT